jgi:hypothetical protein
MIKIETIMMPYVEYPLKAHKKYKAKIKKALKKSVLEEIINEDMHVYKTDYAVPQDLEKPYRSILRTFLDEAMGYITYSLGYSKTQVLHLFATEMKKNDAIDWGTYGSNFTGIYAFDIPDDKWELKWFNAVEKRIDVLRIKEGDVIFFPSYLNHTLINLGKPKTFFIFSINFSGGKNIEKLMSDAK